MDDSRLREIESRLETANDGPWLLEDWEGDPSLKVVFMHPLRGFGGQSGQGVMVDSINAPLVANAPIDLKDLLAEVRRLSEELETCRQENEDARQLAEAIQKVSTGPAS